MFVKIVCSVLYLTFKQSEKDELIKNQSEPVFTVHEFQGKQEKNVIVIRIRNKAEEILTRLLLMINCLHS